LSINADFRHYPCSGRQAVWQNKAMERERAIAILRDHERELRRLGVASASLFGSVARGENGAQDVDIAVRLGANFCKPGLDYFGRLDDLERRLSEVLGCKVDVVEEPARKPRLQTEIDRDRAIAF
jgi:predicted nucleotidyltransferase